MCLLKGTWPCVHWSIDQVPALQKGRCFCLLTVQCLTSCSRRKSRRASIYEPMILFQKVVQQLIVQHKKDWLLDYIFVVLLKWSSVSFQHKVSLLREKRVKSSEFKHMAFSFIKPLEICRGGEIKSGTCDISCRKKMSWPVVVCHADTIWGLAVILPPCQYLINSNALWTYFKMKAVNRVEYNIQLGLYTFAPGCGFAILHMFEKDVLRVLVESEGCACFLRYTCVAHWLQFHVISLLNPFEGLNPLFI